MSNETERNPKLRRVIVTYTDQGIVVEHKNVGNWSMAVSMLIDALQGARIQETQEIAKKAKEQIVTGDPSQIPNLRS
jgi:hypothetical protein